MSKKEQLQGPGTDEPISYMVKYPGVPVKLGWKTYLMPPLGMKAVCDHDALKKITALQEQAKKGKEGGLEAFSSQMVNNLIDLVHMALLRNYPDITRDEVFDGVPDVITATLLIGPLVSQNDVVQNEMAEMLKNSLTQLRSPETEKTDK